MATIHIENMEQVVSRRSMLARVVALVGVTAWAAPAHGAQRPRIELGEVNVRVRRRERELSETLRTTLQQRLRDLELPPSRQPKHYILHASLVRLRTEKSGGEMSTTCVVSATLRQAEGGTLHAILRGRATSAGSRRDHNERIALKAAVRSVLGRVPDAVATR